MPPANSPSPSLTPGAVPVGFPPVNRSPPTPPPPSYDATADLSYLSSPVPDFAATLHTTQESDDADEANVSFLRNSLESLEQGPDSRQSRSHIDPPRDPRRTSDHPGLHSQTSDRLQRILARLNRVHDPLGSSAASAYGNRTPSPNRQNRLYDWAPSVEEPTQDENELDQILAELRRQQPLSQSQLDSSRQRSRDTPSELPDAAERRDRLRERRRRDTEWMSRRAVLQRTRQESSPSTTERMLRYVMERERSGLSEEEERARGAGWFTPPPGRPNNEQHRNGNTAAAREPWSLPSASELRARTLVERAEVMQRRHVAENASARHSRTSTPPIPSNSGSSSSQFLENALKYLDQLRSCFQYEDALSAAIDHSLATKEFFADKHDDFVMDLAEVEPVAFSSWLQPASKFEGHQHAMNGTMGLLQTRQNSPATHTTEQINPHYRHQGVSTTGPGFDHPPGSTRFQPFDATRPWLAHQPTPQLLNGLSPLAFKSSDDHWPVRVTLHSIDPERMTLQGTMEAYDVPQHSSSISSIVSTPERPKAGKRHAPITTYVQGHIIDLSTHSFLTPSPADLQRQGPHPTSAHNQTPYTSLCDAIAFPAANAHIDASNWRKLPPFSALPSDEEMARCLLSRARMGRVHAEYIFMRWKERCFVHSKDDKCSEADRGGDQDRGHGLTISGFYYISLRRSDGLVEGLYFDPTSTPYQRLRLEGHRTGWPAVEMR